MEPKSDRTERNNPTITSINGPVVKITGAAGLSMNELVVIGSEKLLGEVVELYRDGATVQVFEDTTGLKPETPVSGPGAAAFCGTGPGYDRPHF